MRLFKIRYFHRWARAEGLTDDQLKKAVEEMEQGLHDGNLGEHVYKKTNWRFGQRKAWRL